MIKLLPCNKILFERYYPHSGLAADWLICWLKVSLGADKRWLLDYSLVAPPAFSPGYLESSHKAEFFSAADPSEAPFQPPPLPSTVAADRMVTFRASSYPLNTAGCVESLFVFARWRRHALFASVAFPVMECCRVDDSYF